ncbi:glutathione synthase/RimK-type ligase-like ATP-grasp enzyme [Breoghania corrubedonensis]|uniref:Glutathione synthase/RimK-type ligase-like ATP-grasp enzyme n=1 Tax=Breoghania corrubedonensis TaxID=665038 RepID=A0A2T5VD09_9HYPH|nr:RimK family protein [Breoghania corrubedonensis]PTW61638.1 glutathione synthase/RimK-type ligase-like ATP-grasp enzyme [Breoghania corrubedonensis]
MAAWVILVDHAKDFSNAETPHKVMTVREYITSPRLFRGAHPTIVNLSRSYAYQGAGYYASLLAAARGHRVIPNVETMVDLSRKTLYRIALPELEDSLNRELRGAAEPTEGNLRLTICFGAVREARFLRFARLLFDWFRAPLIQVTIKYGEWSTIDRIRTVSIHDISDEDRDFFHEALEVYSRRSWRAPKTRAQLKYSLAVLRNPKEVLPPTSPASLRYLAKLAQRHGVEVVEIGKDNFHQLAQYDALFIRETTSIDNHTYRFAKRAVQEGMPVIDDPVSMIRCTNKVYLAELLEAHGIPTPKTVIMSSLKDTPRMEEKLGYPVVLKIPDGSFSRGVFKVENRTDAEARLKELFEDSDLVLAQEFCPTEFDWRVGVLDGEPLFVCQYMMAKKHWQIIHHEKGKPAVEGDFKPCALNEAPPEVIDNAVRAARLIGQGLYGVDIKETDGRCVVIEVNDNPNLEHGVEDAAEKEFVWDRLVQWFVRRLDAHYSG